jgi:hypothetical protein
MFHVPPAMVKAGLVQLPVCVVCGINTVAGPTATGAEAAVVELDPAAAVVVVAPAAAVVVVAPAAVEDPPAVAPLGGGSLYPVPPLALLPDPPAVPVLPLIAIPTTAATRIAATSCQVFHERRSLIFRSPFSGTPASTVDGGGVAEPGLGGGWPL